MHSGIDRPTEAKDYIWIPRVYEVLERCLVQIVRAAGPDIDSMGHNSTDGAFY